MGVSPAALTPRPPPCKSRKPPKPTQTPLAQTSLHPAAPGSVDTAIDPPPQAPRPRQWNSPPSTRKVRSCAPDVPAAPSTAAEQSRIAQSRSRTPQSPPQSSPRPETSAHWPDGRGPDWDLHSPPKILPVPHFSRVL